MRIARASLPNVSALGRNHVCFCNECDDDVGHSPPASRLRETNSRLVLGDSCFNDVMIDDCVCVCLIQVSDEYIQIYMSAFRMLFHLYIFRESNRFSILANARRRRRRRLLRTRRDNRMVMNVCGNGEWMGGSRLADCH